MNDLETLEHDLRRMLQRRAADIEDHQPSQSATSSFGNRWRTGRPLMGAAAVVVALTAGILLGNDPQPDRISTGDSVATDITSDPGVEGSTTPPPPRLTYDAALAYALALLPPGFDPAASPSVSIDHSVNDPFAVATAYLSQTWGVESPTVHQVEGSADPLIVRWTTPDSAGLVLLRSTHLAVEVVAVTTDGVAVTAVERSVDELSATVELSPSRTVDLEFTTRAGQPLGPTHVVDAANGSVTVSAGPDVVLTRLAALDPPVMMAFAIAPVAFATECGSEPPIAIDVGAMAGPLVTGPIIEGLNTPIGNQRVWHHPSDRADLEIRWPADPDLISRIAVGPDQKSWGVDDPYHGGPSAPLARSHAVLLLDQPAQDPCAYLQITVDGDPAVAGWWAEALSAEWNFDYPLSIAELAPESTIDDPGQSVDGPVIVESADLTSIPTIPDTGSCDGLPDAPPEVGPGSGDAQPDPVTALTTFLDNRPHMLAPSGYTEIVIDGTVAAYAVMDDQGVYTVVEVEEATDGWIVIGWTGSAC